MSTLEFPVSGGKHKYSIQEELDEFQEGAQRCMREEDEQDDEDAGDLRCGRLRFPQAGVRVAGRSTGATEAGTDFAAGHQSVLKEGAGKDRKENGDHSLDQ